MTVTAMGAGERLGSGEEGIAADYNFWGGWHQSGLGWPGAAGRVGSWCGVAIGIPGDGGRCPPYGTGSYLEPMGYWVSKDSVR